MKSPAEHSLVYKQLSARKPKNQASQKLLGDELYNELTKEQESGTKAIQSGYSYQTNLFDVENDAFPRGMDALKAVNKQAVSK